MVSRPTESATIQQNPPVCAYTRGSFGGGVSSWMKCSRRYQSSRRSATSTAPASTIRVPVAQAPAF